MPETIEPQLDELRRRARRRLVGAVVLALAAAVLVPMLLESDPKPLGEDVLVRIPPVDDAKFASKLPARSTEPPPPAAPVKPAPAPIEPPKEAVAQAPALPAAKETPTADPPKPVQPASPKPAPADPAKAAPAKPAAGAFSVQLAAFADDKGANALVSRLKKSGHPAYTEAYNTSRGTLWRVRVGPFPTREAAETARTKLKADGQNGIIAAAP